MFKDNKKGANIKVDFASLNGSERLKYIPRELLEKIDIPNKFTWGVGYIHRRVPEDHDGSLMCDEAKGIGSYGKCLSGIKE